MCPREAIPEPWRSFLNELDRIAISMVRLDCIGGFVVTMLYGLSRPTADVDVLEIAPRAVADAFSQVAMLGGPLFQKYGVYLDRVTIAQPPYEYGTRWYASICFQSASNRCQRSKDATYPHTAMKP
jgi:hypothetical protein